MKKMFTRTLKLLVLLCVLTSVVFGQAADPELWRTVMGSVALGDMNRLKSIYDTNKLDIDYELAEVFDFAPSPKGGRGSLLHHAIQSLDFLNYNQQAEQAINFALGRCANTNIQILVRRHGNVDPSLISLTPLEFIRHEKALDEQDHETSRIAIFERLINKLSNLAPCSKEAAKQKPDETEEISTSDWVERSDNFSVIMIRNNSAKQWLKVEGILLSGCTNVAIVCGLDDGGTAYNGSGQNLPPNSIGAYLIVMKRDSKLAQDYQYQYWVKACKRAGCL